MWGSNLPTPANNLHRVDFRSEHDLNGTLLLPNLQKNTLDAGAQLSANKSLFVLPEMVDVTGLDAIILESPISLPPFLTALIDPKHEAGKRMYIHPVYEPETLQGAVQEWFRRFRTPDNHYTYTESRIKKMGFTRPQIQP